MPVELLKCSDCGEALRAGEPHVCASYVERCVVAIYCDPKDLQLAYDKERRMAQIIAPSECVLQANWKRRADMARVPKVCVVSAQGAVQAIAEGLLNFAAACAIQGQPDVPAAPQG